jgi:hypothetical protein
MEYVLSGRAAWRGTGFRIAQEFPVGWTGGSIDTRDRPFRLIINGSTGAPWRPMAISVSARRMLERTFHCIYPCAWTPHRSGSSEHNPSAPKARQTPGAAAHAPGERGSPSRQKRVSGLRKRNAGRKRTASRESQARECKPCSILLRPRAKPPRFSTPAAIVLGKALRVLPETELLKPVSDILMSLRWWQPVLDPLGLGFLDGVQIDQRAQLGPLLLDRD